MTDTLTDFIERPQRYIRKSDGVEIIAADWPDGNVSWRFDFSNMPVISFKKIVGTCSAKTFERNHVVKA
ncbi:hypothetical protein Cp1R7AA1_057 [Mesorhizobium phage Cp1R7A-A1]|nr:hypothetical protein Cp1R7AA1_057 [Mesorhizobium phage Cp1R7A-A1]